MGHQLTLIEPNWSSGTWCFIKLKCWRLTVLCRCCIKLLAIRVLTIPQVAIWQTVAHARHRLTELHGATLQPTFKMSNEKRSESLFEKIVRWHVLGLSGRVGGIVRTPNTKGKQFWNSEDKNRKINLLKAISKMVNFLNYVSVPHHFRLKVYEKVSSSARRERGINISVDNDVRQRSS